MSQEMEYIRQQQELIELQAQHIKLLKQEEQTAIRNMILCLTIIGILTFIIGLHIGATLYENQKEKEKEEVGVSWMLHRGTQAMGSNARGGRLA